MSNFIVREGTRRVDTDQTDYSPDAWDWLTDMRWAATWVGVVLLTLFLLAMSAGYASAWWPRLVVWLS